MKPPSHALFPTTPFRERTMTRAGHFLVLAGAIFLSWAATPSTAAAQQTRKPNILIIVGDDMGYGDIGVHGCKDIPTPHIDSLAKNGIRFSSGYVSGPYCSPTRAGIMTGRYQTRFGHEFNPGPKPAANFGLPLDQRTVAQLLRALGYRTGIVGKWHLGDGKHHPLERGFDEYYGFLGGAHPYFPGKGVPILRGKQEIEEKEYLTDAFRREAVDFIGRHKKEPFFLYLTFNAVHMPLQASDKYLQRFGAIKNDTRQKYAAMMSAMDDAIGAVLAKLREEGLEEDTLIFFISDNGGPPVNGSSNGPLRGFKAQTWEGGIRVPFLMQWKGRLPAGKTVDYPVIQLDMLPTALAAAGQEAKAEWKLDGVNLLPYLEGKKAGVPHQALYWRFGNQNAIRMGDHVLVEANGSKGKELYNLREDIGQTKNLAAAQPERVRMMEAAWVEWDRGNVPAAWLPGKDKEKKKKKDGE
jgi:arylsulfatase A-like enzyme